MTGPQNGAQWRWAEALAIEKLHGDAATAFVAQRIGTLAQAGDAAGVERFMAIAACLGHLQKGRGSQQ